MAPPLRATAVALVACWLLASAARPFGAVDVSAQSATERDIYVSVLNKADEPVTGLQPDDFIVRENGVRREVLRARRATDPMDLAILVDNSQAAAPAILDIRGGLEGLVARMREIADIALITYGERPKVLVEYTRDPAVLAKGIGRIFAIPGSGAYMLDAVAETVAGLEKRGATRAAIIVISVADREFSNLQYDQVLGPLLASGAALHVLSITSDMQPLDDESRNREILIDRGTSGTGGRRQFLLASMNVAGALDHLAAELLNQYRVTYARPESLVPPDQFEVGVRPEGLTARGTFVPVRKKT